MVKVKDTPRSAGAKRVLEKQLQRLQEQLRLIHGSESENINEDDDSVSRLFIFHFKCFSLVIYSVYLFLEQLRSW